MTRLCNGYLHYSEKPTAAVMRWIFTHKRAGDTLTAAEVVENAGIEGLTAMQVSAMLRRYCDYFEKSHKAGHLEYRVKIVERVEHECRDRYD